MTTNGLLNFVYAPDDPIKLIFNEGERVQFAIESIRSHANGFSLKVLVCSGQHADCFTVLPFKFRTSKGDRAWSTKSFLTIFFKPEELVNGMSVDRLVGRKFWATSILRSGIGKTSTVIQDWIDYDIAE